MPGQDNNGNVDVFSENDNQTTLVTQNYDLNEEDNNEVPPAPPVLQHTGHQIDNFSIFNNNQPIPTVHGINNIDFSL